MLYSEILACIYIEVSFINHYTVPTSQSEVRVMPSDNNQPRQDNDSSQVEHTNGLYLCRILCVVYDTEGTLHAWYI